MNPLRGVFCHSEGIFICKIREEHGEIQNLAPLSIFNILHPQSPNFAQR